MFDYFDWQDRLRKADHEVKVIFDELEDAHTAGELTPEVEELRHECGSVSGVRMGLSDDGDGIAAIEYTGHISGTSFTTHQAIRHIIEKYNGEQECEN